MEKGADQENLKRAPLCGKLHYTTTKQEPLCLSLSLSRVGAKPALDASGCAERGSQASPRRLNRRNPSWLPVARDPPAGPVGRSELSSSPSSFSSLLILLPPQTSDWRSLIGEAQNISSNEIALFVCCGVSDSLREIFLFLCPSGGGHALASFLLLCNSPYHPDRACLL